MFLKSHKWVDIPITRYERYRELRVRESTHTVMTWDKRYFDPDTGKYDSNKIQTLNSESLIDLIDDNENYSYNNYPTMLGWGNYIRERPKFNFPKFVPKDDDFDEEERLEKERIAKHKESLFAKKEEIERKIAENRQKLIEKEEEYQKFLKKREEELAKQRAAMQTTGPLSGRLVLTITNIRPNSWRPK